MGQENRKGKDLVQMFWGMIWGQSRRSPLVDMERDETTPHNGYSRWSYIDALEEGLLPFADPGFVFQQDNAPIHRAQQVQNWVIDHGIHVMEWPPYSPDLSPIEHLWWALKRKVLELHPELEDQGYTAEALDSLIAASKEAWTAIEDNVIIGCLESMPRRVEALIAADGWYTKY